jgi:TonB family protein
MPADPTERMLLAAKVNGLTGAEMQPWHLKASFQWMDENGNVKDQGTIEEWWAAPKKNRVTYTLTGISQSFYQTEHGRFRSGSGGVVPELAVEAQNEFASPLPAPEFLQHQTIDEQDQDSGNTKLVCLTVKFPRAPNATATRMGPLYCMDPDKPILRLIAIGLSQSIGNKIATFQRRFVPQDIKIKRAGKALLTAHLDTLESLKTVEDADFTPPPDAVVAPRKIAISSGVATGLLVKLERPEYPLVAKTTGVQGTVVLQARIGKDGSISEPRLVSGPPLLQQAAIDAVKRWIYRPYVLNGETVEVETTINVVFNLGSSTLMR